MLHFVVQVEHSMSTPMDVLSVRVPVMPKIVIREEFPIGTLLEKLTEMMFLSKA
jgi:hypothetical protein